MELTQENYRAGDDYVVDSIETDGAELLFTKIVNLKSPLQCLDATLNAKAIDGP